MESEMNEQRRRVVLAGLATIPLRTIAAMADADNPSKITFTVEAKPEAVTLDVTRTALIVIDMQNDFGSKGGMFDLAGIDISGIKKAIAPTARALAAARDAGIKVIYLKMAYRPDLSDLGALDSVNRVRHLHMNVGKTVRAPDGRESRILIRDTWNTDIVSDLQPKAEDIVMYKTRFSGFYKTELDATLNRLAVRHLIITGCTTSICVESTVRDAMFRDYLPILLADCMSEPIGQGPARSNHEATLLSPKCCSAGYRARISSSSASRDPRDRATLEPYFMKKGDLC
jgi:ureidoacrylate peracid hydrolase